MFNIIETVLFKTDVNICDINSNKQLFHTQRISEIKQSKYEKYCTLIMYSTSVKIKLLTVLLLFDI